METFGHFLKANRERQGIRLEEIASITKINLRSLEHLEQEAWDKLPPEPFIRGFIVAYAKYIHLDIKDVLRRYQDAVLPAAKLVIEPPTSVQTSEAAAAVAPAESVPSANESKKDIYPPQEDFQKMDEIRLSFLAWDNSKRWLLGACAVLVVAFAFFVIRIGQQATENNLIVQNETPALELEATPERKVEANVKVSPSPVVPTTEGRSVAANNPEVAAPEFKHQLDIEGNERSWMKIVVDDAVPQEMFLAEGQKVSYRAKEKIKLVLGNSAVSKVLHNGEETPGKKLQGTIRFYIFPENAHFPQDKIQKVVKAASPAEEANRAPTEETAKAEAPATAPTED